MWSMCKEYFIKMHAFWLTCYYLAVKYARRRTKCIKTWKYYIQPRISMLKIFHKNAYVYCTTCYHFAVKYERRRTKCIKLGNITYMISMLKYVI